MEYPGNNLEAITGIILAGGKSSRMGKDKASVVFKNKMLIEYSFAVLQPICQTILISGNHTNLNYFNLPVVPDIIPECGPMGGIYTCLEKSTTYFNLVLSCDIPFMRTDVLEYLLALIDNFDLAVPISNDGFIQPLCGIYTKKLAPLLLDSIKQKTFKLLNFIEKTNSIKIRIDNSLEFFSPLLFSNINSPDDLYRI